MIYCIIYYIIYCNILYIIYTIYSGICRKTSGPGNVFLLYARMLQPEVIHGTIELSSSVCVGFWSWGFGAQGLGTRAAKVSLLTQQTTNHEVSITERFRNTKPGNVDRLQNTAYSDPCIILLSRRISPQCMCQAHRHPTACSRTQPHANRRRTCRLATGSPKPRKFTSSQRLWGLRSAKTS